MPCEDCGGTGKIVLFTSAEDCHCVFKPRWHNGVLRNDHDSKIISGEQLGYPRVHFEKRSNLISQLAPLEPQGTVFEKTNGNWSRVNVACSDGMRLIAFEHSMDDAVFMQYLNESIHMASPEYRDLVMSAEILGKKLEPDREINPGSPGETVREHRWTKNFGETLKAADVLNVLKANLSRWSEPKAPRQWDIGLLTVRSFQANHYAFNFGFESRSDHQEVIIQWLE